MEQLSCREALFQPFGSIKIIEIENKTIWCYGDCAIYPNSCVCIHSSIHVFQSFKFLFLLFIVSRFSMLTLCWLSLII